MSLNLFFQPAFPGDFSAKLHRWAWLQSVVSSRRLAGRLPIIAKILVFADDYRPQTDNSIHGRLRSSTKRTNQAGESHIVM